MISDLLGITEEVIRLIKSRHIAEAQEIVQKMHRAELTASFCERQKTVHQINLTIHEANRQRAKILDTLALLPTEDQLLARHRIEQICCDLFDQQISELKTKKRQLSRTQSGRAIN